LEVGVVWRSVTGQRSAYEPFLHRAVTAAILFFDGQVRDVNVVVDRWRVVTILVV
jgi:hypothetical protein